MKTALLIAELLLWSGQGTLFSDGVQAVLADSGTISL